MSSENKKTAYRQAAIDVFGDTFSPEFLERFLTAVEMSIDTSHPIIMQENLGGILLHSSVPDVVSKAVEKCDPYIKDRIEFSSALRAAKAEQLGQNADARLVMGEMIMETISMRAHANAALTAG